MIKVTDKAVRRAIEWLDADDAEILNVAECLGMDDVESSDEDYRRAWVLLQMSSDKLRWRPGLEDLWWKLQGWVQDLAGDVEWRERWGAWPHCNGQDQCWMHYPEGDGRWCSCVCRWCGIARRVRRDGRRRRSLEEN